MIMARLKTVAWTLLAVLLSASVIWATPLPSASDLGTVPSESEPVTHNGLRVVVRPTKAVFIGEEPLCFDVTLKNISRKKFFLNLYGWSENFGAHEVHIEGVPTGGPWVAESRRKGEWLPITPEGSRRISASSSCTLRIRLDRDYYRRRDETPEKQEAPLYFLPPEKYRASIHLNFHLNESIKDGKPQYVGELKANPVAFRIAPEPARRAPEN
jgi:hypothetical protein